MLSSIPAVSFIANLTQVERTTGDKIICFFFKVYVLMLSDYDSFVLQGVFHLYKWRNINWKVAIKTFHINVSQNTFTIRIYQQCFPVNMFLAKKWTKWKQKNSSHINYLILLLQTKYTVTHCLCGDTELIHSLVNVKDSKFKTIYINVELTALISAPN